MVNFRRAWWRLPKYLALAASLGLASCSGSTGGGIPVETVTTNLRILQPGDSWTWNYSGTSTANGVATPFSGTEQTSVVSVTPGSNLNMIVESVSNTQTINGATTTTNSTETLEQDVGNRVISPVSSTSAGVTTTVKSNTGYGILGTFGSGEALDGTLTYSDGSIDQASFKCVALDGTPVYVLNAAWLTWSAGTVSTVTSGGKVTSRASSQKWAPSIGTFVAESSKETEPDGTVIQETQYLKATSIASTSWSVNPAQRIIER